MLRNYDIIYYIFKEMAFNFFLQLQIKMFKTRKNNKLAKYCQHYN